MEALTKDPKGSVTAKRRKAAAARKRAEIKVKLEVIRLDGQSSRWPTERGLHQRRALHVDHHAPKGMGGDHGLRTTLRNLITLTYESHLGTRSVHSGHKRILPMTKAGTRGVCAFFERDNEVGGTGYTPWRCIGREKWAVGEFEFLPMNLRVCPQCGENCDQPDEVGGVTGGPVGCPFCHWIDGQEVV